MVESPVIGEFQYVIGQDAATIYNLPFPQNEPNDHLRFFPTSYESMILIYRH